MPRKKYQKPLSLDMDLNEALERLAGTDVAEVRQEVERDIADQRVRMTKREPLGDPLLIYESDRGTKVELPYRDQSLWASQRQMAQMFGVQVPAINKHLTNVYGEGELTREATISVSEIVQKEGSREVKRQVELYNLNAIISVGYRIESKAGTRFRIWATEKLVQILTKGFYIDADRLKQSPEEGIIAELRDTIRDIRASTANAYREVKRMCALCQDYDGTSKAAQDFFATMENKMLWLASSHTGPELIVSRADATKPNMGLTFYSGKKGPTQADVKIANNYLAEGEAKQKNRATVMLLDYFEEQLDQGRLVTMAEAENKLDEFIKFNRWPLLTHKGKVSRAAANEHAGRQLDLFRAEALR